MKRLLPAVLITLSAVLASPTPGGEAADEKGPLQADKVIAELRKLAVLGWSGDRLAVDREAHEAGGKPAGQVAAEMEQRYIQQGMAADQAARLAEQMARFHSGAGISGIWRQLASATGSNRRSASMGGEKSTHSFSGGSIEGKLVQNKGSIEIELAEKNGPLRTLKLTDNGKGVLEVELSGEKCGTVLKISQSSGGEFKAEWKRAGDAAKSSVAGRSFAEAYAENREVLEGGLFPYMKKLGLGLPPTPMSPEVIAAVLAELRPPSEKDRTAAAALFKKLDSEGFRERESAGEELSKAYSRFRRLIARYLARKDISEEARGRLELIVEGHPEQARISGTLTALHLLDDAGYLGALLGKLKGADRDLVVKRLAELKGKR